MTRKLTLALLSLLLAISCNRKDEPASRFIINGIQDVDMGTSGTVFPVWINQTDGTPENVVLIVSGLPLNVGATIVPPNGTPDFNALITFYYGGGAVPSPGTYPVHIAGTAPSFRKEYTLNLTVPPFNGFYVNDKVYRTASISRTDSGITVMSSDNVMGTLEVVRGTSYQWPTANGTYTVSAGDGQNLDFRFTPIGNITPSHDVTGIGTATVTVNAGKVAIRTGDLPTSGTHGSGTLRLDIRE